MKRAQAMRSTLRAFGAVLLLAAGRAHADTVTYIYTDPQGTPLAEADIHGNITATFDYAPYGSQAMGATHDGPGYTGHVNDADTGLVYMQARYYDPVVGRFVSTDPVGPGPGNVFNFNRYAYANNNPVVNMDADGRMTGRLTNPEGVGVAGSGYVMFVNPSQSEGGGVSKASVRSKSHGQTSSSQSGTQDGNRGGAPKQDRAPAKLRLLGHADSSQGNVTQYAYQLQNSMGHDLTGDGYQYLEHVVQIYSQGDELGSAVDGNYENARSGVIYDNVGVVGEYNGPLPHNINSIDLTQQTFSVDYRGKQYTLSTVLLHMTVVTNGNVTVAESKIISP